MAVARAAAVPPRSWLSPIGDGSGSTSSLGPAPRGRARANTRGAASRTVTLRPRVPLLRLPTTILVLASLGFLGLGEQPPTPEWGRLLSENQPYVELAPWAVAGPAVALVLLAVAAVGAVGTGRGGRAWIPARGRRSRRGTGSASGLTTE
ncbi:hypothetical protein [Streptomyces sp. NPDC005525]|uniref:hypothetical protein n=1 Tax=Streptomyces sp. NPDC005525 TaxID=3364720 RepID=UPI003679F5B5